MPASSSDVDFTNEEQVKDYMERIGIEYRYLCYKENDAEVCNLLGQYFQSVKNQTEQAKKIFKVNCDTNKWKDSCYRYSYMLDQESKPENRDEVIHYANEGCLAGHAKSCYMASVKMGEKAEKNPDLPDRESLFRKSLELMDKACLGRLGRACYNLSAIYFTGIPEIKLKKDVKKVLEYSVKGCENDDLKSCVNATLMYLKGEGTEKNEELAKTYDEKARFLKTAAQMPDLSPFQ